MRALSGVDFDVEAGEVHCLLGPNGAGKSTLIKCVSGAVAPTEGEILVDGEPLPVGEPSAAIAVGVATIYQELDLVEDLSVSDSIFLGHEHRRGPLLDRDAMRRETTRAAQAPRPREHLPARARARAAARGAADRLDRPRAVAERPAADHGRAVLDPRRRRGRDAVRRRAAADRRGRRRRLHLAPARRDPAHRLARDRALRRPHRRHRPAGRHARRARSWRRWSGAGSTSSSRTGPKPATPATSCSTCAGSRARPTCATSPSRSARARCVGIGGLVGAGRTELLRLIYGLDAARRGRGRRRGQAPAVRAGRRAAIAAGLGLAPEDRKSQGLLLDWSLAKNVTLADLGRSCAAA